MVYWSRRNSHYFLSFIEQSTIVIGTYLDRNPILRSCRFSSIFYAFCFLHSPRRRSVRSRVQRCRFDFINDVHCNQHDRLGNDKSPLRDLSNTATLWRADGSNREVRALSSDNSRFCLPREDDNRHTLRPDTYSNERVGGGEKKCR